MVMLHPPVDGFPLKVKLNGVEVIHYSSLHIDRDMDNFVDSFGISINNPQGKYSREIPVGCKFELYYNNILIFRGYVETKEADWSAVGSKLTLTGREELCNITENDADPTIGPFKNKVDNDILRLVLSGQSRELQLGNGAVIKEYAISGGGVRIGQVVDDIVKHNDFIIYKRGNTLYKKAVPTKVVGTVNTKFRMIESDSKIKFMNSDVLSLTITEDLSKVRSSLTGFGYQQGKLKTGVKQVVNNSDLSSGNYANRVRNGTTLVGEKISRKGFVTSSGKDSTELTKQINRTAKLTDMTAEIKLTVAEFIDLDLLQIVQVDISQEAINQYMYVKGIKYVLEESNKRYTEVTLSPFSKLG